MKTLKLINPHDITDEDCPVFVQSSDTKSFFGWGIRKRTKSNWNHSMIMRKSGHFCTQGWTYKEVLIEKYMKRGIMMKFWVCQDITAEEKNAIMIKIKVDLKKPWYKKMYDIPGVVGQLFGLRWFNVPSLNYCSERTASKDRVILPNIPPHPTPENRDHIFQNSPRLELLGYYIGV